MWNSLALLLGISFLFGIVIGVLPPLLAALKEEFHLTTLQIGMINSVFGLARMVIDLPAGRYLRRAGSVPALMGAVLLAIVGSLVMGSAGRYQVILAGRALVGLGTGIAYVVILTVLFQDFPRTVRGRVTALYESARTLSLGVASLGAGYLAQSLGWRGVIFSAGLAAGIALGLAALWALCFGAADAAARMGPTGLVPNPHPRGDPSPALRRRPRGRLPIYGISFLLAFCWGGVLFTLFPLYGGGPLRLSPHIVGWALTLGAFSNVLLLFPLGWWSDHVGRIPVLSGGVGILALAIFLIPHGGGPWSFVGIGALLGVGFSIWAQPPALLVERSAGSETAAVVGSYRFASDVGYVSGPLVLGLFSSRLGPELAFRFTALGLALAVLTLVVDTGRGKFA